MSVFLKRSEKLALNFLDCRGQRQDNGGNIKGKKAGLQARILPINSKALYLPSANFFLLLFSASP